jgi:DNA-binding PadR family transcriptional regulator
MMVVLKKLAADGFVQRYVETNSPRDRWELTPVGSIVFAEAKADSQNRIIRYAIAIEKSESNYSAFFLAGIDVCKSSIVCCLLTERPAEQE